MGSFYSFLGFKKPSGVHICIQAQWQHEIFIFTYRLLILLPYHICLNYASFFWYFSRLKSHQQYSHKSINVYLRASTVKCETYNGLEWSAFQLQKR